MHAPTHHTTPTTRTTHTTRAPRSHGAHFGLALLLWLLLTSPAHAKRVALLMGNSQYQNESVLRNPLRDAELMASTLKGAALRFDQVVVLPNGTRPQMLQKLAEFKRQAQGADVALVYYSGHGMINSKRQNHVLPVDMPKISANAGLDVDVALKSYAVSEDEIIEAVQEAKVQVVVLDACRDNGFGASKSGTKGLSRRADESKNRLIAYATEQGHIAEDGAGSNSTYAASLAKHLVRTDWPLLTVFDAVTDDVERSTGGKQSPTRSGNLRVNVYLLASVAPVATGLPVVAQPQADPEQEAWQAAKAANTVTAYEAYLAEYPRGKFASAARIARGALVAAGNGGGAGAATLANQSAAQASTPSPQPAQPGQSFRDCTGAHCPEMVVIPAGSFVMGSNDGEADEKPPHSVSVRSFALGKYEVTQGQWKAVMGSNPSKFSDCGDNCPVERVSWDDIQQYLAKLNAMTGMKYRLASEAEWEYAARAGCSTAFNVGGQCRDKIEASEANFDGNDTYNGSAEGVYRQKTTAVGSFRANNWGLHDMHGNVREWVEDVWHNNYAGAPTDGSAWKSGGDSSPRVLRGGSWSGYPVSLRSAIRSRFSPGDGGSFIGFRIARTVP